MLVIRDALLLQLQQDRLRQEIIVAELTKIDRAMDPSSTSCHAAVAGNMKWTKPHSFSFSEKFMPHHRWPLTPEHWADLNCHYDLKERAMHRCPESRTVKSAMEDRVGECSRCCTGKECEGKATPNEQRLQEYNKVSIVMLVFHHHYRFLPRICYFGVLHNVGRAQFPESFRSTS